MAWSLPLQRGVLGQSWKKCFDCFCFQALKICPGHIVHKQKSKTRSAIQAPKLAAKVLLRNHFFLVSPRRRRYHSLQREAFSAWRSHAAGSHWIYHHLGVHNPRITKLLHNCSTPWLPQIHEQDCGEGHTNNR